MNELPGHGEEKYGFHQPIIPLQPFRVITEDHTSVNHFPLFKDLPDRGKDSRYETIYSLTLTPQLEGKERKIVNAIVSLISVHPDNIAQMLPPITPFDTLQTYPFSDVDHHGAPREAKLRGYSKDEKRAILQNNPLELSILISLKESGIMARDPDDTSWEIEKIPYVADEGFEYITRLALVIDTPLGPFIAFPNPTILRDSRVLEYRQWSPVEIVSDGSYVYDDMTLFPAGNPMTFPEDENVKRVSQLEARFMISPVSQPSFELS